MPGAPTFNVAAAYGGNQAPSAAAQGAGTGSSAAFIVWVVILGIILPAVILGGLKMGGFSFVFKGR